MRKAALIFALLLSLPAAAQSLLLKAGVKDGRIGLRIAPASAEVWMQLRSCGLIAERVNVPQNVALNDLSFENAEQLTRTPLLPLAENDSASWKKLIAENSSAVLAHNFLYKSGAAAKTKKQNEQMLFGLVLLSADLDTALANALGLLVRDALAGKNAHYAYRVRPAKNLPGIAAATILVSTQDESVYPQIGSLQGKFDDRFVKLSWDTEREYGAYVIERSGDSLHFEEVSKAPVVHFRSQFEATKTRMDFRDTFPENKKTYWYRVRGINCFGERCTASNAVRGRGYFRLQGFPLIDSVATKKDQAVIRWRLSLPADREHIKELLLLRGGQEGGPYGKIAALPLRENGEALDEHPQRLNFYKIAAIDFGGDTICSYSAMGLIYDETPPAPPAALQGRIDEKGRVTLRWAANAENDLQGYRVFRSNSLNEEFAEISSLIITKPGFKDSLSLHTLAQEVYYRVQAVDKNFNNSPPSGPLKLQRPDTIPPVAAMIRHLRIEKRGIAMDFIPSPSADAQQYVLYRETGERKDSALKLWPAKDSLREFLDTSLQQGRGYRYKLLVFDKSENFSASNQPYIFYETGAREKISSLQALADRSAHEIRLSWKKEAQVFRYILYKGKKGEPFREFRTLRAEETQLSDRALNMGNTYVYRIKAILLNGMETEMSEEVTVEY